MFICVIELHLYGEHDLEVHTSAGFLIIVAFGGFFPIFQSVK